ncbi:MAG: formate--tetrahydrofolate ligase [Fuerstia sp.]|nr:formate--tetrahydrofolate ligase [Fuerstiella sp.]
MLNSSDQDVAPKPIAEIAAQLGLDEKSVEPYGWYAGKLSLGLHERLTDRPTGKYIGVTAINPTPFGEGKTVVSIGLAMALARRRHRSIVTLREPSLAPVFGIKGGGAGGGRACQLPAEDINLHFTGDLHAVAAANNLLAAMIDNHCKRGLTPTLSADGILWRRVIDISDKGLAHIESGLDDTPQAPRRHTGFDLTAASEVMSILALAKNLADLRERLGRIVVARSLTDEFVTAEHLGAAGAMTALLRNALRPNLVQTVEHTPAIVHAGPFANISHGNSSVIADLTALRLADYVVTEGGFGSDLGAEKFFNIKCRADGLRPDAEVLVCTVRALKFHSGRFDVRPGRPLPQNLLQEDLDALRVGFANVEGHLANLSPYGIPVVVAINQFPTDTSAELNLLRSLALESGAQRVTQTSAFSQGGDGSLELADAVIDACSGASSFQSLYALDLSYERKIEKIATQTYGADGVDFHDGVAEKLSEFARHGYGNLPVCIAKTQYSLSHDSKKLGRPAGFRLPIREVRLSAGAGFVLVLTDGISLMPGLPREPAARRIDVDREGRIAGLGN